MRVKDTVAQYITYELNRTGQLHALIEGMFPQWNKNNQMVTCFSHTDTKASLHINELGQAKCHGCGWYASNVVALYADKNNIAYDRAKAELYAMAVSAIPQSKVLRFAHLLGRSRAAMRYLREERGLTETTVKLFYLGLDPHTHRISIPIFGYDGTTCANIRLVAWGKYRRGQTSKVVNSDGNGTVRLYPEWHVQKEMKLLFVEGEFDALVGRQFGLPACTWTGGAGSWNEAFVPLLEGKTVFVLYDNDDAGREGAQQLNARLTKIGCATEILPPQCEEGKDLSDWARLDPTKVGFLEQDIRLHETVKTKVLSVCPTCGRAYDE